jgi:hypothetical protein
MNNSSVRLLCISLLSAALQSCPVHATPSFGFGIGRSPSEYLKGVVEPLHLSSAEGRWLRTSLPDPSTASPAEITSQREALVALRTLGFRSCILLRFEPASWKDGVRPGVGYHLPADLREAYQRGRAYAATYGDVVDTWEIDNEPDISFVQENPETFAAYHKAMYHGLTQSLRPRKASVGEWVKRFFAPSTTDAIPRVLMAPLALPPGPYLERLAENDFLSYTDGINYHYYGYAEDFTGVYRQFENAVTQFAAKSDSRGRIAKKFPVFLTEYGYGLLGGPASNTAEGRERQRRWFADVASQIYALRIAGPMAFTLNPYLELGHNEFGLFTKPTDSTAATPSGAPRTNELPSPALRALWDYAAAHPYHPRMWDLRLPRASDIVIDFLPGPNLDLLKTHRGYLVSGRGPARPKTLDGTGRFMIYNFGSKPQRGKLKISRGAAFTGNADPLSLAGQPLELLPGGRVELPVTLTVSDEHFSLHDVTLRFEPDDPDLAVAHWKTSVLPAADGMKSAVRFDFAAGRADTASNLAALQARPLAREEPALHLDVGWLVSAGVTVQASPTLWRFTVTALPTEPLRPAMVELPLPPGFRFSPGELLSLNYRLGLPQLMTAPLRPMLDVYFRTATGNLFQVWPRQYPRDDWQNYWQHAENFTEGFFGRAAGAWRFTEQIPVALVFFFRPIRLPAVFEIANPQIVTFARPTP